MGKSDKKEQFILWDRKDHRMIAGPFSTREEATAAISRIRTHDENPTLTVESVTA